MASNLTPVSSNVPIVDDKGNPTPYFQRLLQVLLQEKATTDDLAEAAVQGSRLLTAGTGLTGGGDLSADRTFAIDTTTEAERIRDVIAAALVAGTNMTITVDDALDQITLAAAGGGGGGSSSEELLGVYTYDGVNNRTSVTFGSIPQTYDELRLEIAIGGDNNLYVQANGDTGAVYGSKMHKAFATSNIDQAQTASTATAWRVEQYFQGTVLAGQVRFPNYNHATQGKGGYWSGGGGSNGSGSMIVGHGIFTSNITAPITSLRVYTATGNLGQTGAIRLIGIKAPVATVGATVTAT